MKKSRLFSILVLLVVFAATLLPVGGASAGFSDHCDEQEGCYNASEAFASITTGSDGGGPYVKAYGLAQVWEGPTAGLFGDGDGGVTGPTNGYIYVKAQLYWRWYPKFPNWILLDEDEETYIPPNDDADHFANALAKEYYPWGDYKAVYNVTIKHWHIPPGDRFRRTRIWSDSWIDYESY